MTEVFDALSTFVRGRLSYEELREALHGVVEFSAQNGEERIRFLGPQLPTVDFEVSDVRRMLASYLRGDVTADQIATWATVVTLLGCFEIRQQSGESRSTAWEALQHLAAPSVSGALEHANAKAWLERLNLHGG